MNESAEIGAGRLKKVGFRLKLYVYELWSGNYRLVSGPGGFVLRTTPLSIFNGTAGPNHT